MCGFGVILGKSRDRVRFALSAFNSALAHRGPDDEGTHVLRTGAGLTLGLAHRRLSILDLSAAGHQPMLDAVTGNVIVFNGEIYNHRALADALRSLGERFVGTSDTEVLLKAYRHFGAERLLRQLRGMFAFAIWDAEKQALLVARDPCGIKPLYFANTRDGFACASEAGALTRAGIVDGGLEPRAVDSFLAYGSVQPPLCIYRGVSALLPGHAVWVSGDGVMREPAPYWSWRLTRRDSQLDSIVARLETSMRRHLVADVPIGVFLSGGFDSTALTMLATRLSDSPVRTFTMAFPEVPEMSEAEAARSVAARLGARHDTIELREADLPRALPAFFDAMDQPSDDGLNVFLISRGVAQAGIKSCLHGVGGDELFGGYPSFDQVPKARMLSAIPAQLRRVLARLVQGDTVVRAKLANLLRSDLSLLAAFLVRRSLFSYEQRRALLGDEPPLGRSGMPREWLSYASSRVAETLDGFGAISSLELVHYAGGKLLTDGDVMSMAHGLELRFPLLDVDLVQAVLAMPAIQKRSARETADKPLLTACIDGFPSDLMSSRKRGFTLPLERWLRKGLGVESKLATAELIENLGLERVAIERAWRRLDESVGGQEWLRAWQLHVLGSWLHHGAGRATQASAA